MVHTPPGLKPEPTNVYLQSAKFIDADHPAIRAYAAKTVGAEKDPVAQAVKLFYAVRDGWRYDPFNVQLQPDEYVASSILAMRNAWCVQKATLLAALARVVGIHAAVGFSDVTNHLTTEKLKERMGGTTLFVYHGYAVLYLNGKWVKAAPVFNIELCTRFGVLPTEFDGTEDAVFQEYDAHNQRHMEYLRDHGMWSDFPYETIEQGMRANYPASFFELAKSAERFEDGKKLS
jgi:transglutaminase-like putative cysteine protease